MLVDFRQISFFRSENLRRLLFRVLAAAVLIFFYEPLARGELLSASHLRQTTGEESISIIRVEDDLMVRWLCPPFQKTSLFILNANGEWKGMDGASTASAETQFYCVPRASRRSLFRSSFEELQEFPRLRIMAPSRFIPGLPTPIRIEALRPDGCVDWEVWEGEFQLSASGDGVTLSPDTLSLHNGVASGLLTIEGDGAAVIRVDYEGSSADKTISVLPPSPGEMTVAGELTRTITTWKPVESVIHVTDNIIIPADYLLRIYPDTIVLLDPKKSITVNGAIESLGTVEHPVLFTAADPDNPWGEISHADTSGKSIYRGTFFIEGGDSPGAGHTGRGPVIRVNHAELEFDRCNIMDNYGKGLYGSHGKLTFTHCLFSRCAMGMEVVDTDISVDRCFFLEMPLGGDIADNDPIYLHGGGDMSVTNSIFAIGGDDGIDTLGSHPVIENCIIRGFLDKGVTVYYGTTRVKNCLILSNDYGVSAKGDGSDVYVDNTTIAGNRCSLQSRDKYNVPDAVIKYYVTNSILWGTEREVQTDYPIEDISITYSVVQGAEPFPGDGNITDDPLFVDSDANNFRLDGDSPCRGAGENAADMGCVYADLP